MAKKVKNESAEEKVEILLEHKKSESSIIRVQKLTYSDGNSFIDLRNFYTTQKDPTVKPGKGVSLPYDRKLWSKICKAIKSEFTGE